MTTISAISGALYQPSSVRFTQALDVANQVPPVTQAEAETFVELCLRRAKTKSELLAKALPYPATHTQCLDVVATMCGFASWHEMVSFGKRFVEMTPEKRANTFESHRLCFTLWVLSTDKTDYPQLVEQLLELQRQLLEDLYKMDSAFAKEVQKRVMFGKADKKQIEEVLYAMRDFHGLGPEYFIQNILYRRPVVAGNIGEWPPLARMTVSELLDTPCANMDHQEIAFGYPGWQHATADMVSLMEFYKETEDLEKAYQNELWAGTTKTHTGNKNAVDLDKHQLSTGAALIANRGALEEMVCSLRPLSVLDALTTKVNGDGFYRQFYAGPPEQVESDWAEDCRLSDPDEIKRIAFRKPLGEHQLSVFRYRRYCETKGERVYEIEAVLHDRHDALVAKLGIVLLYSDRQGSSEGIIWACDETDQDDLREAGIELARAAHEGVIQEDALQRVMVLRDWEVRATKQGKGLGTTLLVAALPISLKGLPKPYVLGLRLHPLQMAVPEKHGMPAPLPDDLLRSSAQLRNYWEKVVQGDVGRWLPNNIVYLNHQWLCHGGSNTLALRALAFARKLYT